VSGILYLHHRTALYRAYFLIWAFSVVSLVSQGLVKSSPQMIFAFAFPCFVLSASLTDLLCRTLDLRARWRIYLTAFAAAAASSAALMMTSAPFWAIALPCSMAIALPLFDMIVQALDVGWRRLTITAKCTIVVVLLDALHVLDYPFLRNSQRLAFLGFAIGIVLAFALSIIGPAIVLEKAHAEVRQALETLRDEQARREDAERVARQAQKLELVGQFAAGLAHDFNNLLAVVQCWGEIGLSERANASQRDEARASILTACKQGAALARQLLTIGRRNARSVQDLHLDEAVDSAMSVLRRLLPEDIELVTENVGKVLISVDEMDVQQVLLNFVVNARDAMPRGGRLQVSTGAREVPTAESLVCGQLTPGWWAFLDVQDTGHGIEPALRPHIFEPFFTTKQDGVGTGLGLATVAHIARESNGAVGFESEPGKGARFTFYWREAARGSAAEPRSGHRPALAPLRGAVVLVVEDNVSIRHVMLSILEQAGHRVLVAPDGDRALQAIGGAVSIDLLCTDAVLPGGPAPAVIAAFEAKYPGRPVLVVSGYIQGDLTARGIEQGRYRLLHKPFTVDELNEAVADLLQQRGRTPDSAVHHR
jgi:signal transduction histidine kinase/CheY-like chemotaxis protein